MPKELKYQEMRALGVGEYFRESDPEKVRLFRSISTYFKLKDHKRFSIMRDPLTPGSWVIRRLA